MTARIGEEESESDDSSSGFGAMALAASYQHSSPPGRRRPRATTQAVALAPWPWLRLTTTAHHPDRRRPGPRRGRAGEVCCQGRENSSIPTRTLAGCGRSLSLMLLGWLGFRDTLRGTWSTTCLRYRPSSFWYRRCKMRFVLQAAARRARGRAGDLHAHDPSPITIVSTSDCCGAAGGGRAERRAAESTSWTSQGGEQYDFAGMWT